MTTSRTIYANDFLTQMAIGKQNAMNRRNRGLGTSGPVVVYIAFIITCIYWRKS